MEYTPMNLNKFFILFLLACSVGSVSSAFGRADTIRCRFYFPVGSSMLDLSYRGNGAILDSALAGISSRQKHSKLLRVNLRSGASPEGNMGLNKRLSERRLAALHAVFRERLSIPESSFVCSSMGEDWEGLYSLVEGSDMPYREKVLHIIRHTPVWVVQNGAVVDSRKRQLMNLQGGSVWKYMNEHFFAELRNCSVVECEFESVNRGNVPDTIIHYIKADTIVHHVKVDTIVVRVLVEPGVGRSGTDQDASTVNRTCRPFYMGLKTNLLYDALLVPNLGAEFYLGKGWSLGGNWMHAWWHNNSRHRYWRLYGGELNLRKYFGTREGKSPLSGHHLGVYGQLLTYDFEFGGKGIMGGKPSGTIYDKSNFGAGIEYGYSKPVARRLNLDFSIGVGYLGGTYYEYVPKGNCYVWQATKKRNWFGPTKAEISLVWLIGHGNVNNK